MKSLVRHDPSTLDPCELAVWRCWQCGTARVVEICRRTGYASSAVSRALGNLRACGLLAVVVEPEDEPEPTPEQKAEIEARLAALKPVKEAWHGAHGDRIDLPLEELDRVLPPVACRRTRIRERRRA